MAQTAAAIHHHLRVRGITDLTVIYMWAPPADSNPIQCLEAAHQAEFWEMCDELTTTTHAYRSLHYACVAGNEGIIKMVISRCKYGFNGLLEVQAHNGREIAVRAMLEAGATSIAPALSLAAYHGHMSIVALLLKAHASNPVRINWGELVVLTCRSRRVDVARVLLNVRDIHHHHWTQIIHNAATQGHDDVIQLCVERNAFQHTQPGEWDSYKLSAAHHPSTFALLSTLRSRRD
jgi:hypothetical protein